MQQSSTYGLEDISGTDYFVYRGGGGNETSFFSPDPTAQYSTEIIDTTTQTGIHYIYADDSNYFDDTTMSRVIRMVPEIADGFNITEIVLSGLPADFIVEGAVQSGTDWIITNPTPVADDTIRIILSYDVPNTSTFTLNMSATVEYDPGSGVPTPVLTEVTQSITRTVNIQDVNTSTDYNGGVNTWVLANNQNDNRIFTGTGDATVYGSGANDSITAFEGNDTIYGGAGDDIIRAGAGNDYINAGSGNNYIDGGDGIDTIDYSEKTADIVLSVASAALQSVVIGTETDQIANIENIISGSGDDTLTGSSGDNTIIGNAGDDTISGGLGNDRLEGGDGSDTISYAYSTVGITLNLGTADINGDITLVVQAGDTDSINGFENIIGTNQADVLTGDNNANIIYGGGGNDTLSGGGAGINYLHGGAGTDTISYASYVNAVNIDMTVTDVDGFYTVNFSDATYEYAQSIEIFRDTAFNDTFIGDGTDTTFYLSSGTDHVDGGLGTDTVDYLYAAGAITLDMVNSNALDGGGSTDTFVNIDRFYASNNADTIYTSAGNDWVNGRNGNDLFYGSAGDDTLDGGSGTDTIDYSNATGSMNINLNTATATGWGTDTISNFENVVGSNFDDVITVRNANGTVDGLTGSDTVNVSFASSSTVNMGTINGGGYFTLSAGSRTFTIRNVDNLVGTSGTDDWRGDANNNTFDGAGGNDYFRYSLGDDTYIGGTGTNTLDYSGYGTALTVDMSVLNGNGRIDVTFDSIAKVDEFAQIQIFRGTDAGDHITGDASANTIYGGLGDDTIYGGAGNDVIYDGAGADTIYGGANDDIINADTTSNDNDSYYGEGGTDTISYSSGSAAVTYNINAGTVTGYGVDNISGFEIYQGTSAGDSFYGSNSGETMMGLGGNDTFFSSNGNDSIDGGSGTDTVDYSGEAGAITLNISTTSTVTKQSGTDTLTSIESIEGSSYDDIFVLNNYTSLLNYTNIRGNGGNDEIRVTAAVTTFDGVNLASFFSEIEEIDFTASSLAGSDSFLITGNDVKSLTDTNDYLHITVNTGFTVNVSSGSTFLLTGSSTIGDTTTYTFDNGGDSVTLDVQTL